MATNYFSLANFLGEGAFGQTYIATLDGENVVIKRLKRTSSENTLQEINYLGFVRHPNLVKVIGHCSDGFNRLLVSEFVSNKTLKYHLYGECFFIEIFIITSCISLTLYPLPYFRVSLPPQKSEPRKL
ncbi:hypothetical protein MANES_04G127280v8 [Manihot esculenta]|uniref:Uncharacterized protein n=1 Tax=Manihot esculenta TaxID=3983 RepID=A0ACB7HX50_MANES|nr:hypothetical protein MANES_04G127280v8 [Manihot esculenta]